MGQYLYGGIINCALVAQERKCKISNLPIEEFDFIGVSFGIAICYP